MPNPKLPRVLCALVLLSAAPAALAARFVYEGRLDDGGRPANGRYDLELTAYGHAALGATLAAPVTFEGVEVKEGRFRLDVDLPLVEADQVWLEVAVRASGEPIFAAIPGRSKAIAAPLIGACWSTTGDTGSNPAVNFIGTTDAQPFVVRTRNVQSLRIEPSAELFGGNPITANVIAGSSANNVTAGVRGATIAGGGVPSGDSDPNFGLEGPNRVTDAYGTVGGGYANRAGDDAGTTIDRAFATVGGGGVNAATGNISTVGGGIGNTASGIASTVGGGIQNVASGLSSTVSGGSSNCAGGDSSWAGGKGAKVRPANDPGGTGACDGLTYPGSFGDQGTFVWADSQSGNFVSTGENQFLIRAAGGMAVNTNTPRGTLTVTGTDKWSPTIGNGWGDFTVGDATRGLAVGVSLTGGGAGTVRLWGKGGTENIVFTSATNPAFDTLVVASAGRAGVRRFPAANAFEVEGNASKTTAGDWLANSDARIKTEVADVTGAVERILKLRPVTFRYTPEYRAAHPSVGDGVYWNVIAQEYAVVFPEAVKGSGEHVPGLAKTAENEILQVDLHPATVTTIAAVQELAVRLEQAEAENLALRTESAELRSAQERIAGENAALRAESTELRARLERLEALIAGGAGVER